MNYELAKKLKDAGFPQIYGKFGDKLPESDFAYEEGIDDEIHLIHRDNDTGWRIGNDYSHAKMTDDEMQRNYVKVPTLSELIEACGEDLALICTDKIWRASEGLDDCGGWTEPSGTGRTAEEAVAILWLALNKK